MDKIPFVKMNGCGNDFVVVDNRDDKMKDIILSEFVPKVCARRVSVGADGFMMVEPSDKADYRMRYFNADGSEGEMCGNGARCLSKFAYIIGAAGVDMTFETMAGIYEAHILKDGKSVKVKFPSIPLKEVALNQSGVFKGNEKKYHYATVGVPHVTLFEDNVSQIDYQSLVSIGRAMRHSTEVFPQGTNVNFAQVTDEENVIIRTYERGVEDETFACGTGSTATAVIAHLLGYVRPPVHMHTRAGALTIHFRTGKDEIAEVFMEGGAKLVAEGYLLEDSWK